MFLSSCLVQKGEMRSRPARRDAFVVNIMGTRVKTGKDLRIKNFLLYNTFNVDKL